MNLLEAVRLCAKPQQGSAAATAEIAVKDGTVISVAQDGTPTVSLDGGETAAASLATDYPMTEGLRVRVLPAPDGYLVIGVIT
jgi:hypothetical protein